MDREKIRSVPVSVGEWDATCVRDACGQRTRSVGAGAVLLRALEECVVIETPVLTKRSSRE